MKTVRYFILVVLLLIPSALAQAEFDVYGFDMTEFRNIETVDEACGAPAASSFFCGRQGESLTRIPTKGQISFSIRPVSWSRYSASNRRVRDCGPTPSTAGRT